MKHMLDAERIIIIIFRSVQGLLRFSFQNLHRVGTVRSDSTFDLLNVEGFCVITHTVTVVFDLRFRICKVVGSDFAKPSSSIPFIS